MQEPRPGLNGLIRMLAVAVVVMFTLSGVSIAYAAGRQIAVSPGTGSTSVRTAD